MCCRAIPAMLRRMQGKLSIARIRSKLHAQIARGRRRSQSSKAALAIPAQRRFASATIAGDRSIPMMWRKRDASAARCARCRSRCRAHPDRPRASPNRRAMPRAPPWRGRGSPGRRANRAPPPPPARRRQPGRIVPGWRRGGRRRRPRSARLRPGRRHASGLRGAALASCASRSNGARPVAREPLQAFPQRRQRARRQQQVHQRDLGRNLAGEIACEHARAAGGQAAASASLSGGRIGGSDAARVLARSTAPQAYL